MSTHGKTLGMLVVLLAGVSASARGQEPSSQVMADWQYYNNTGWQAVDRGRLERAAQAFRLAIDTMKPYEATQRGLLARSYADFARVLYLQKRYDEAEPMARWALSVREKSPGDRSEALSQSLDLLAKVQIARGKSAEAAPLLKREVEVQQKALGHDHPDQIPAVEALAGIYAGQGKVDEAEPLYRRAMALREQNTEWILKQAERLEQTAFVMRQVGGSNIGFCWRPPGVPVGPGRAADQPWRGRWCHPGVAGRDGRDDRELRRHAPPRRPGRRGRQPRRPRPGAPRRRGDLAAREPRGRNSRRFRSREGALVA
ncbi:MAG: tetratricopeptide repeat protein [Isosphaeraceae bacterium]